MLSVLSFHWHELQGVEASGSRVEQAGIQALQKSKILNLVTDKSQILVAKVKVALHIKA